jgi:glyceraldehyde-3-phosphate dehydrogenase (ferredoxin)
MPRQRALHVQLTDGDHDLVEVESPHFIGLVEYAWENRNDNDPTVLGVGPLAGTIVPGASSLAIAGRSPLWDGFYPSLIEGAGLPFVGLDCSFLALRGRAARPSVLVVRRLGGALQVRVEPLDPEPLWKGTHDGEGLFALLHHLAARHGEELTSARVLAVGPAATRTRYAAVGSVAVEAGHTAPVVGWLRRGGWGSRLYQEHGLCAIVYGSDRSTKELLARDLSDGVLLDKFKPGMSLSELETALRWEWGPKLKAWGDLGATLSTLRQRTLWFNFSSVHLTEEERDDLYRRVLRGSTMTHLLGEIERAGQHLTCGEPCPLASRKVVDGRLLEFETYAALGPQLGIADHAAADRVVRRCESLGFDALAVGGIVGWLMERLHRGLADPVELGLSARPRWSAKELDPDADSQHNAKLAEELLSGLLFGRWGAPFSSGLRGAVRSAPASAAALAVYNANGDGGEMVPYPYWAPGFFTPMPVGGEFYQYYGLEFVPPRVLGRKSAQRMEAELMLQNLGFCRLHRGWAEDLVGDLVNRHLGTSTDWRGHHRTLARSIYRRRKARFWETQRVVDIVASFLQNYQHEAAPDAELDRWVRRFREDKASAARAYWSEINAGLEEILGS